MVTFKAEDLKSVRSHSYRERMAVRGMSSDKWCPVMKQSQNRTMVKMQTQGIEEERRYQRLLMLINQLSSLIAFLPPLFAIFAGIELVDYMLIFLFQITLILVLSSFKYNIERKYREIDVGPLSYILGNTLSYALISISIPILFLLIDFFYRLQPVVRVVIINVLFIIGLLFLMSNLPVSRLKRISKPLEDQYLINQANQLASKIGTGKLDIFIMKLGKFKIANAGQVGARKYSVFISDYLLDNLSPDENVAVIAHEFAHAREKHVLKNILEAWIISVLSVNLIVVPVDIRFQPFSSFLLPGLGLFILLLGSLYIIPTIRRRYEIQADLIASEIFDGELLIRALEKIMVLNHEQGDSPRYWSMDHPTTRERIGRIRKYIADHKGVSR